jgi:hypothetical protein
MVCWVEFEMSETETQSYQLELSETWSLYLQSFKTFHRVYIP